MKAFSEIDLSSLGRHFVWMAFGGGIPYLITEFKKPLRCRGLKPRTWEKEGGRERWSVNMYAWRETVCVRVREREREREERGGELMCTVSQTVTEIFINAGVCTQY